MHAEPTGLPYPLPQWKPCHAVGANGPEGSGFDRGRDELNRQFQFAGHWTVYEFIGNTQTMHQCNGGFAGSDGYVLYIELLHPH